jgi:hypothetical protein
MNAPITITAPTIAWLPNWRSVKDLTTAIGEGKDQRVIDSLSYASWDMGKGENPYTRIGEASITVTIESQDALVAQQIATLNAQLANERAKFMERQAEILEQINKLQALEYVEAGQEL